MLLIFFFRSIFQTVFLFVRYFIQYVALHGNFILKKVFWLDNEFDCLSLRWIFKWFIYGTILRTKIITMTQRFVAVERRAVPFVLWQHSSLTQFRIYNRSASSRNHHRTYVVTCLRTFSSTVLSPQSASYCISRGRYKSNRHGNSRRTKQGPISTSRFAHRNTA